MERQTDSSDFKKLYKNVVASEISAVAAPMYYMIPYPRVPVWSSVSVCIPLM